MTLQRLTIRNLTVFSEVDLAFSKQINVIVGENGAGKTHLLKLAYSVIATLWEEGRKPSATTPTKSHLQVKLADKLVNVFRPEVLGRLTRRKPGRERCDVGLEFADNKYNTAFSFATNSKTEVVLETTPSAWLQASAAYFPTRELLTIFPNFVSVYEGHYLEFEETWRDTCLLLGEPLQRGPKEKRIQDLLAPIETAMGGKIELDRTGRFYLHTSNARLELPLVAEGQRKLGMLARLIATGALLDHGFLFWDEPEANLNPLLIKEVAKSILTLSATGIQVFFATHSLFLLREIEILAAQQTFATIHARFFGLQKAVDGSVGVFQGDAIDEIGDLALLDEELAQSNRFLDT
jgi:energy-coupling factor transporter ATP-binding protein EcfA2